MLDAAGYMYLRLSLIKPTDQWAYTARRPAAGILYSNVTLVMQTTGTLIIELNVCIQLGTSPVRRSFSEFTGDSKTNP